MLGIALDLGGPSVLDGDKNSAAVGTIVRAGSVNNSLHQVHLCMRLSHEGLPELVIYRLCFWFAGEFKFTLFRPSGDVRRPVKTGFVIKLSARL
jgi:hypothetical protein